MTREIYLEIASLEHMTKQPQGLRYALFCKAALKGMYGFNCETQRKMGHIEDFAIYAEAKQKGEDHLHSVLVRFYPDLDNGEPSDDFLADLSRLHSDHRVL